jgi:hypothetical protein
LDQDAIAAGAWPELVAVVWEVSLEVDPYTGFKAGIIGLRASISTDLNPTRASVFAIATSVT